MEDKAELGQEEELFAREKEKMQGPAEQNGDLYNKWATQTKNKRGLAGPRVERERGG
jgi:hypothetical protein